LDHQRAFTAFSDALVLEIHIFNALDIGQRLNYWAVEFNVSLDDLHLVIFVHQAFFVRLLADKPTKFEFIILEAEHANHCVS
jgi:hypothetical protein